jgi:uncharacterized protein involved in cysteine biosynthesis
MKRVLIVKEGHFGEVKQEEYAEEIELFRHALEVAEVPSLIGREKKEKAAKVEVVETAQEVEKILSREKVDAVVFISRGMESSAEKIASSYPKTRITVFTGLIPDGKVVWVDKTWITGKEIIQRPVLR